MGGKGWLEKDMKKLLGVMIMFYILIGAWVTQVYAFVKNHEMYS